MIEATVLVEAVSADLSDAPYLTSLETAAVALVQRQTGRYFGPPATGTFVLRGDGTRNLWLPEPATAAVATVQERAYPGATATAITGSATDGFEQRTKGSEGLLVRKGGLVWTRGYEYTVTSMLYGYATGAEPADIRELVKHLVMAWWAVRPQGAGVMQSETRGRVSITLESDLMVAVPGARETIESWRRHEV